MDSEIRICSDCKHLRSKIRANPFSARIDHLSPEILKEINKWEEKQNEIAELERHRFEMGAEFDFEPNFYPWCASWTKMNGRFSIDPVTGIKTPIYVLCAHGNEQGDCPRFEAKEGG